jgi:hypothetical protein
LGTKFADPSAGRSGRSTAAADVSNSPWDGAGIEARLAWRLGLVPPRRASAASTDFEHTGDRHRIHAAGHRCDHLGNIDSLGACNIANQARFPRAIRNTVDDDIDDDVIPGIIDDIRPSDDDGVQTVCGGDRTVSGREQSGGT